MLVFLSVLVNYISSTFPFLLWSQVHPIGNQIGDLNVTLCKYLLRILTTGCTISHEVVSSKSVFYQRPLKNMFLVSNGAKLNQIRTCALVQHEDLKTITADLGDIFVAAS